LNDARIEEAFTKDLVEGMKEIGDARVQGHLRLIETD